MDIYGIGNAIKALFSTYFNLSRGSGRTSTMIKTLKSGDGIVFLREIEAKRVINLCKQKGLNIQYILNSKPDLDEVMTLCAAFRGNLVFDHSWIEQYYLDRFDRAEKNIIQVQKLISGE